MKMTPELASQITTAAFCGYIMLKENLKQPEAMVCMAELCSLTQIALGLGNIEMPGIKVADS